jgi:hypothetical protein
MYDFDEQLLQRIDSDSGRNSAADAASPAPQAGQRQSPWTAATPATPQIARYDTGRHQRLHREGLPVAALFHRGTVFRERLAAATGGQPASGSRGGTPRHHGVERHAAGSKPLVHRTARPFAAPPIGPSSGTGGGQPATAGPANPTRPAIDTPAPPRPGNSSGQPSVPSGVDFASVAAGAWGSVLRDFRARAEAAGQWLRGFFTPQAGAGGAGPNTVYPLDPHLRTPPQAVFSPADEARRVLGAHTPEADSSDLRLRQKALEFFERFEQEWGRAILDTARAARSSGLS